MGKRVSTCVHLGGVCVWWWWGGGEHGTHGHRHRHGAHRYLVRSERDRLATLVRRVEGLALGVLGGGPALVVAFAARRRQGVGLALTSTDFLRCSDQKNKRNRYFGLLDLRCPGSERHAQRGGNGSWFGRCATERRGRGGGGAGNGNTGASASSRCLVPVSDRGAG